jgi:hypothetical protein
MGGAPIIGSSLDAGAFAFGKMRQDNLGLSGTATIAFWRFINNISYGFGGGSLATTVTVYRQDGSVVNENTDASTGSVPPGAWYKTLVPGAILTALDIGVSFAARKFAKVKSAPRLLGMKLIGGS